MKKEVKLEELLRLYAVQPMSTKWILRGGDILEYIGQKIVMIDYNKKEDGTWNTEVVPVTIKSISNYDKLLMKYDLVYIDEDGKEHKEKIIPQGLTEGKDGKIKRFYPYSVHLALMEKLEFFDRLSRLYENRETLSLDEVTELSKTKRLGEMRNVGAIVKANDGEDTIMYIKAEKLEIVHHKNCESHIFFHNLGRRFHVSFNEGDKEYALKEKGEVLGKLKLVDLQE